MAATVLFALLASLVIALTLMPVLASYAFKRGVVEKETWLMRRFRRPYGTVLRRALRFPLITTGVAALIFMASVALVPFLGSEFIPTLDEGSIVVMMYRVPGISVEESLHGNEIIESVLHHFPEVSKVVSRTGRPEVATDPMAIDQSDVYVFLKPVSEWPRKRTKEELINAMKERLEREAPGAGYSFSQPIQMRMQELMEAGIRSDIAVKIFGDDLQVLRRTADQVASVIRQQVQGAADVRAERVAGLPYTRIQVRREAIARHGIDAAAVLDTVEAIGGKPVGQVVEGNRRFPLQVRWDPADRDTVEEIGNLKVGDDHGHFIPLAQLASVIDEEGPAQVSRENGQRRVSVEVNVRNRDTGSFVAEARERVNRQVQVLPGYSIEWGGKFEQLESAMGQLVIAVPAALLLIFVLLYFNFGAAPPVALIFLNVPLAASGGILALAAREMPLSISAGVGFIALSGIAVLNGIVLLTYISQMRDSGVALEHAVEEGSLSRLRPVLMTALVASLGFVPMAFSQGAGAEVQRPLATVVIGGLITSTFVTLLVLPSLYLWLARRGERRATPG
jgi:cobalt-zinc-cadmium resistance protein CzcA